MNSFYTDSNISNVLAPNTLLATGRPSHIIPVEKKDGAWCLQMVKSAHNDFRNNCPNLFFNAREKYNENVRYFQALIDPGKYMDLYDNNKSETKNQTSVSRDKRILNVASKYIRILKNRLNDRKFDIVATPINALARQHEEEFSSRLRAAMKVKKITEQYNVPQVAQMLQELGFENLPVDNDELEIQKSNLSIPYQMAMGIELFLKYSNSIDRIEDKLMEEDLNVILMGVYATQCRTGIDGTPIAEVIDPRSLLVGYSNTENFRDISEVGQYRQITVTELMEEDINGDLTKEQLREIELFFSQNDFTRFDSRSQIPYNNDQSVTKKGLVLDFYFYSYNEDVKVLKNNSAGNPRIYRKPFDYYKGKESDFEKNNPTKKLFRTKNQVVYKCTWIVGTDFVYNYGLFRDTPRDQSDPYRTKLPILINAPLIKDGYTQALMDEIMPLIDSANLKWQKMQDAIAKARPSGLAIDTDALLSAVENLNDAAYTKEVALEMAIKENIHIYSGAAQKFGGNGAKPVQELQGGLGADFGGWLDGLRSDLMLIQEITGFNSVAAGSPQKYMGKGVSDNVMETADYSIKHLYEAKRMHYEDICRTKVMMGMDVIAAGEAIGIKNGIGTDTYEYIKLNQQASKYQYNIDIMHSASDQMWADIYQDCKDAVILGPQNGGITLSDSLVVKECTTIKQAKAYLYRSINQHKKDAEISQRQMMQDKANMDQETAKNSAMLKQQELAASLEIDAKIIELNKNANIELENHKHNNKMQENQQNNVAKSFHIETKEESNKEQTQMKVNQNLDRNRIPGK